MNPEERYEQIEAYLAGTLTGEKLTNFERDLKSDAALREEVSLHRELAESLKGDRVHELRRQLSEVNREWNPTGQMATDRGSVIRMRLRPLYRISAVAAAILVVAFVYQFLTVPRYMEPQHLFAEHYKPYKMILSQRSENGDAPKAALLNHGVNAYQQKDYEQASRAFQALYEKENNNISYLFYAAISELSGKSSATAIVKLNNVLQKDGHLFMEQSRWYLAMAYLQQGDTDSARKTLASIQEGQFMHDEAKEVLKRLR